MGAGVGCSGEDPPPKEVPTAAQVRDYFGLNAGSCWRYRYREGNATLFARVDITGPNDTSVAGKTVYVRKFAFESGGLPAEWFLDTETDAEVRLVRATSGLSRDARETRRYDMEAPLFGRLEFDIRNDIDLSPGQTFTVEATTPELCTGTDQTCAAGNAERHEWTVVSEEEVSTPDGSMMSFKMNYRVRDDMGSNTEFYNLVPGRGMAKITDGEGTVYQACAWRVCDSTGACVGAESCDQLDCQ